MPLSSSSPAARASSDVRLDADPRHHAVGGDLSAAERGENQPAIAHCPLGDRVAGQDLDPFFAIEVVEEAGQVRREDAAADRLVGKKSW